MASFSVQIVVLSTLLEGPSSLMEKLLNPLSGKTTIKDFCLRWLKKNILLHNLDDCIWQIENAMDCLEEYTDKR